MKNTRISGLATLLLATLASSAEAITSIPLLDLGGRAGFHIVGQETDDWFGLPVAGVGDFNGDGIDDFLVGAEHGSPGAESGTYLIFGRSTSFPPDFDLASLNGTNGMRIDMPNRNGFDASAAGDYNDDGYADVIIGNPDFNVSRGRACVVFGGPTHPAVLSLNAIDGSNGTCFLGVSEYDNTGALVAAAGDLNGDGIADIAMGSTIMNVRAVDDGGVYVVFGHAGPFPPALPLSAIDGSTGFTFAGRNAGDNLGISAARVGDVNGDGRDDLVIGSEDEDSRRGAAHVLFGRVTSWPALLGPESIDGVIGFSLRGARNNDGLGRGVGGLDFDADGYSDVVAGTTLGGPGSPTGSTSIIYGHAGPFQAQVDVGTLDGASGRNIYGTTLYERAGEQSGNAGDVNGDGIDDLMITAPFANYAGISTGSMYIVFGNAQRGPAQMLSSAIAGRVGFRMDGFDANGYCGQRQRAIGDINADGIDDMVVGCNYSSGGGIHRGSAHVLFGNAAPTVRRNSATVARSSGDRVTFALADVAAAQYLDTQPFAGAAITSSPSSTTGTWWYRQSAVASYLPLPAGLSPFNALVLGPDAQIAFNSGGDFAGSASIALSFWDGSGAYTPGLNNIDGDVGSLGGFAKESNQFAAFVEVRTVLFANGFD